MTTTEMPQLTGANKQIAWANKIRRALIANLREELATAPGTPDQINGLTGIYVGAALRQTDAAWWISQVKDASGSDVVYDVPRKPAATIARLLTVEDKAAITALRG